MMAAAVTPLPDTSIRGRQTATRRHENECPECHADVPVTTPEGFTVCSACGLEYPGSQPYVVSDAPARQGGVLQAHAVKTFHTVTTIGTRAEQAALPRALKWAARVGRSYEQDVFTHAYFEVRTILSRLDFDGCDGMRDAVMVAFAQIFRGLPKRSRARNVHLIALAAVYRVTRQRRISLPKKVLVAKCLDADRHTLKDFHSLLQVTSPQAPRADRRSLARAELSALVAKLALPPAVRAVVIAVAKNARGAFHNPRPGVTAAGITGAAVLIANYRLQCTLSRVARAAGIAGSTLQRAITLACERKNRPLRGTLLQSAGELRAALYPEVPVVPEVPTAHAVKPRARKKAPRMTTAPAPHNPVLQPVVPRVAPAPFAPCRDLNWHHDQTAQKAARGSRWPILPRPRKGAIPAGPPPPPRWPSPRDAGWCGLRSHLSLPVPAIAVPQIHREASIGPAGPPGGSNTPPPPVAAC